MSYVDNVIEQVKEKNPNEPEFIQAVTEVLTSLKPVIESNPAYEKAGLLERIVEPERVVMFRVPGWRRGQRARQPRLPRAVQQLPRALQGGLRCIRR